jgi:hypothetical protein
MTYRISYDNGREAATERMEEYLTEREALGRVRELLEAGEHDGVSVLDSAGNVLCGVRLQLKLGLPVA